MESVDESSYAVQLERSRRRVVDGALAESVGPNSRSQSSRSPSNTSLLVVSSDMFTKY